MGYTQFLATVRNANTKRVMRQFAHQNRLAYLGAVDIADDDNQLIRGATALAAHTDSHYIVGDLYGRDLALLQRSNTLTPPDKQPTQLNWLILQVDLKRRDMPQAFINARIHKEVFYTQLLALDTKIADVTAAVTSAQPDLAKRCTVFALPHHQEALQALLTPELLSTLAGRFSQFDYEIADDRIYVYAATDIATPATLKDMLHAGYWLASALRA